MIKMPLISVIVPVYNVEKYLPRCIESILGQTYTDLELILVDDGSPDGCPQICDAYAAQDNRVMVIHQPNGGVSSARNRGLDTVTGEYISFVDSDDWIDSRMYEIMLSEMQSTGSDMAICGFNYAYENGEIEQITARQESVIYDPKELTEREFDIPWSVRRVAYNKVVKKQVYENLRFNVSLKMAEDSLFFHQSIRHIRTAVFVRMPLYQSFQRTGSAMHGGLKPEDVDAGQRVFWDIIEDVKNTYTDLYDYAYANYIDTCIWTYRSNLQLPKTMSKAERDKQKKSLKNIRRRIRREVPRMVLCRLVGLKKAVAFWMIGLGIR